MVSQETFTQADNDLLPIWQIPIFQRSILSFPMIHRVGKSPKMSHLKQNSLKWLHDVYESIRRF